MVAAPPNLSMGLIRPLRPEHHVRSVNNRRQFGHSLVHAAISKVPSHVVTLVAPAQRVRSSVIDRRPATGLKFCLLSDEPHDLTQ